jgi:cation diffusion facilitator CzcD-associated flavoprotein CzcO
MLNAVIIGAGPYGLSLAAHFRHRGIAFRIFGRPMDTWVNHMPQGMMLKSDGFASNLSDPDREYTLAKFCAEQKIEYGDNVIPVRLDTFNAYGLAFQARMVPELDTRMVTGVERNGEGFTVRLEDGETFAAERVVLAVGITHFENVPASLANLPSEYGSHSARHRDLEPFRGRSVAVVGGGASALDLSGLLRDAGANVELISRRTEVKFHGAPSSRRRSLWQQMRHPVSGLGPGWRSRVYSDAPWAFPYVPQNLRLKIVGRALGPSGGWFSKEKVLGRVPLHLGYSPERAEVVEGKVHLHLRALNGTEREVVVEHVIAATGYKPNMDRLQFLSPDIRSKVKTVEGAPALSRSFESSVPGLYFTGIAAANTFGPVMRFAFGDGFTARTITRALAKSLARSSVPVSVPAAAGSSK